LIIRRAFSEDLAVCAQFDASIETDHVWQMDERSVGADLQIALRPARLPRPMRVPYPRDTTHLNADWERDECFLVASEGSEILGMIDVRVQPWDGVGWVQHLVVARRHRRKGIATRMVQWASEWARRRNLRQLVLESPTKNYPALCLYQRLGCVFCGFNDHAYTTQDIAIFFAYPLGS
jgi:ribosomal protein S18 acetylase RimI-like enzyme